MQKQQKLLPFIKISYKDSLFNLGNQIKNFNDLIEQTKLRFNEYKQFKFIYKENILGSREFDNLLNEQTDKNSKSLKINLIVSEKIPVLDMRRSKTKKFSFNQRDFDQFQNIVQKISPQQISIKIHISPEKVSINTTQNAQYYWQCTLTNCNKFSIPKNVIIKDFRQKQMIQINGMKVNQVKVIKIGPYSQSFAGKYTHLYQIIMKQSEQTIYNLSEKFGFVCHVDKKLYIKQINNKMYERVNKLRNFTSCQKSTQNLILKLKQLGINQKQIDKYEDQILIQMIQAFVQN